jgi:hypothetical protein
MSFPSIHECYDYQFSVGTEQNRDQASSLRGLARECASVLELGVRNFFSCCYLLKGLAESKAPCRSYTGIDLCPLDRIALEQFIRWAEQANIAFQVLQANDLAVRPGSPIDLLHIDSYHTYLHLSCELEQYSPFARKAILIHDTHHPYGFRDEDQEEIENKGIYEVNHANQYSACFSREKRGIWPAVEDFLARHPEWTLERRSCIGTGLSILKRKDI